MPGEGSYSLEQISSDISEIKEYVRDHDIILKGSKSSDTPGGIIYSTNENTKFRKFALKILWLMFATVTGLVLQQAFGILELLIKT